jgi:hypothetical protein
MKKNELPLEEILSNLKLKDLDKVLMFLKHKIKILEEGLKECIAKIEALEVEIKNDKI